MNSLIEVDTNAIQSAFKIDQSKIKVDFGNLNNILTQNTLPTLDLNDILSNIKFSMTADDMKNLMDDLLKGYETYIQNHPEANVGEVGKQLTEYLQSKEVSELLNKKIQEIIKENGSLTITQEQLQSIMTEILSGYEKYVDDNELISVEDLKKYLMEYLNSDEAKNIISNNISEIITSQNLDTQISNIMEKYMQTAISSLSKSLQKEVQSSIKTLSQSITKAISVDSNAIIGAFHMKMNEEELAELFSSLMSKENVTYESNLKSFNYASIDEPSGISIYPKDFEGNQSITNLLNDYKYGRNFNEFCNNNC